MFIYVFVFERQIYKTQKETKKDLLATSSLPKCPPGLGPAEARSQEPNLGLPPGCHPSGYILVATDMGGAGIIMQSGWEGVIQLGF